MRLDLILHDEAEPEPGGGGADDHAAVIEGELPLDAYPHLAAVLLQFPGIKTTGAQHALVDALVLGQILRLAGNRPLPEIRGRADHRHAQVRTDTRRDHVFGERLTQPNTGVEPLRYDVGKP